MKNDINKFEQERRKFKRRKEDQIEKFKEDTKKIAQYRVLAIGCHPDDIELGCGGVITKHIERGDEVTALVMTKGDKGSHHPYNRECEKSMKILGINKIEYGNFPDGFIKDNYETVNLIESLIKKYNINRVYTHYPYDTHQDHRNCSLATSAACRRIGEVLLYSGPSTYPYFEPHYYIAISPENMKTKIKALKSYKTQVSKGIVDLDWVKSNAKINGWKSKTKYAEAFALNHIMKGDDKNEI